MLLRIRQGKVADKDFDLNKDYEIDFQNPLAKHPLHDHEPKRRFVASKWERLKV